MVELRESASLQIRRWATAAVLVLFAMLVVWGMQHRNGAIASAQCSALYKAARTLADTARADRARPDVGGRDVAEAVTCGELRASRSAKVTGYAVDTTFAGLLPALKFDHDSEAVRFRTELRDGIARGPNFAGHFAIVTWGCGTECQSHAVVDLADGTVYGDSVLDFNCHLVAFGRASRLVVMTPADTAAGHVCSSRDTVRLVWVGAQFDTVRQAGP